MAILALVYDNTAGRFYGQLLGSAQIGAQAVLSSQLGSGQIDLIHQYPWASGQVRVGQGSGVTPILQQPMVGIDFVIDGAGAAITSGFKGYLEAPFPLTLARCTLLGDQSGQIKVNIYKDTYANFPPTAAKSICSSYVPLISGSLKYQDTYLSGWVNSIASGDILGYNADSLASNITRVTVALAGYR